MALVSVGRFHWGSMFRQDEGVVESRCKRIVLVLTHPWSGCEILEVKVTGVS